MAIDNRRQIVGYSTSDAGAAHAVLWGAQRRALT
jgi:probable HAF family extracellular repeat protein